MSVQEFVCLEISYGKRCGNAGAQRNHQKTLKKPAIQSSILIFITILKEKRTTEKNGSRAEINNAEAPADQIVDASSILRINRPSLWCTKRLCANYILKSQNRPCDSIEKYSSDMSPFLAPKILLCALNKKPPEFRIADVQMCTTTIPWRGSFQCWIRALELSKCGSSNMKIIWRISKRSLL